MAIRKGTAVRVRVGFEAEADERAKAQIEMLSDWSSENRHSYL
jgi:hypothetical protein